MGSIPSRTDRENGILVTEAYQVTAVEVQSLPNSGPYDDNSVATLVGMVAGAFTRQKLVIVVGEGGNIASISGFDPATRWDHSPRLTITRWDGPGESATFLGY